MYDSKRVKWEEMYTVKTKPLSCVNTFLCGLEFFYGLIGSKYLFIFWEFGVNQ